MARRIVIVGGVAGGAAAATRARRLDESAQIVILERSPHVSVGLCGLPYYLGREIADPDALLVQTPDKLARRFALDVRVQHEAVRIERDARRVVVRDLAADREYTLEYDHLILSPGARPIRPPVAGIDADGVFVVRGLDDALAIDRWIIQRGARRAVVAGGGYIGLEMAEQLRRRGLEITLIEAAGQVLPTLDTEMAALVQRELRANGVALHLNEPLAGIERAGERLAVRTAAGTTLEGDVVIVGVGVRPEVSLARDAGLEIGSLGGIRVNEFMQTSDPAIYAVGDAVEVRHRVTGAWSLVPLAAPAVKQARVAADHIMGRPTAYRGTVGTWIVRVFGVTAAGTGANARQLQAAGMPFEAVHLAPPHHAGYYPGAKPLFIKLLYEPTSGRTLGAQVVGPEGADKRIDVFASAVYAGLTADDLAFLDLAYAPPFGAARDPVNLAGSAAWNRINGDVGYAHWDEIRPASAAEPAPLVLDVRGADEREAGAIPGSLHIPLPELRARAGELPADREIITHCASGQRSYYAARILAQRGRRARSLSGGYRLWSAATAEVARPGPEPPHPGR